MKTREQIYSSYETDQIIEEMIELGCGPRYGPYSFSSLNLCPLSFKKQKIDDDTDLATISRWGNNVGGWMHDLAEFDVRMRLTKDPDDWYTPEDMVDHLCTKKPGASQEMEYLTEALERFRFNFEVDKASYLASEMKLAVDFGLHEVPWDSDEAWFRGIADYISISGGKARVVDFKNYPSIHKYSQINDPHNGVGKQLMGYLSMVMAHVPEIVEAYYEVYYFQFGTSRISSEKDDTDRVQLRYIDRDQVEDWWRFNQRNMLSKDRREKWPPIPSQKSCQYCPVVEDCDFQNVFRTSEDIMCTNHEEAKGLLKELRVVEEKRKRLKAALKTFSKEHGPVETDNGETFGYYPKTKLNVDVKKAFAACEKGGLDPYKYIKMNKAPAEKLIKKLSGEARQEMEASISEDTVTRLSS